MSREGFNKITEELRTETKNRTKDENGKDTFEYANPDKIEALRKAWRDTFNYEAEHYEPRDDTTKKLLERLNKEVNQDLINDICQLLIEGEDYDVLVLLKKANVIGGSKVPNMISNNPLWAEHFERFSGILL